MRHHPTGLKTRIKGGLKNTRWPFPVWKCTSLEESLLQCLSATKLYGIYWPI